MQELIPWQAFTQASKMQHTEQQDVEIPVSQTLTLVNFIANA